MHIPCGLARHFSGDTNSNAYRSIRIPVAPFQQECTLGTTDEDHFRRLHEPRA